MNYFFTYIIAMSVIWKTMILPKLFESAGVQTG